MSITFTDHTNKIQIADGIIYIYFTGEMMIKMVSTIWSTTEYNHFFHISDCSGSYWTRLLPPGNMEQTGLLHCGLWVIIFIQSTQY